MVRFRYVDPLLPEKVVNQFQKRPMLDLSMAADKFLSSLNDFLNLMANELQNSSSE
jgi:hypothetical protein